jgi:hypothetical protein
MSIYISSLDTPVRFVYRLLCDLHIFLLSLIPVPLHI